MKLFKYYFKTRIKLIVGSGGTSQKGFVSSDVDWLDITNWWHWMRSFKKETISVVVAEHVLEHLSHEQILRSCKLIYKYLEKGGTFRLAIPDKNRKDKKYVVEVRPPKDGHVSYMNFNEIGEMLKSVGFRVVPLEYYDNEGKFHYKKWDPKKGIIRRSVRADKQKDFWNGKHYYTSLIVDAIK